MTSPSVGSGDLLGGMGKRGLTRGPDNEIFLWRTEDGLENRSPTATADFEFLPWLTTDIFFLTAIEPSPPSRNATLLWKTSDIFLGCARSLSLDDFFAPEKSLFA